ncbi:MAG: class I SAM-dependent methyltransferase [Oligoflexales bacterium]
MTNTPISDVSDTALWVAAFRAKESARPDALYSDPLAEVLSGERGMAIAREMPYPKILAWLMAVRTVAIDRLIFEAIKAGVDTVINIGAGLDTRPYRLDLPNDLNWIEVDFPHMIELKNAKLASSKPRCRLSRFGLDVSNRSVANKLYQEIGAKTKNALVITEGVIAYLSNDEAGYLAEDLRKIPSFRFWIQDYRKNGRSMRHPQKLKRKLKNAPFLFSHPDQIDFFASFGWQVRSDIKAVDEGERLGRPFPIALPWLLLALFIPKGRREAMREAMGYVLFEAV